MMMVNLVGNIVVHAGLVVFFPPILCLCPGGTSRDKMVNGS